MKKSFMALLLIAVSIVATAQNTLRVEAPAVVGLDEQFNVTFIIEGEDRPSDFEWEAGSDFQLVWGPQKGSSTSIQIINGQRTKSSQYTYTYILSPLKTGKFVLPKARATVAGKDIESTSSNIEVVSNGASSSSSSSGMSSGGSSTSAAVGDIPSEDLFMRLTLSRTNVVVGEPITATLKLYQRVNIAGFEDAKFPTFNGFWSQETAAPSNIQFNRESLDDKIYDAAVLRTYVLIPQQSGTLHIDPAELVCLVNIRTNTRPNSIFDEFFDSGYRTVRKRISTPSMTVNVKSLPAGAPASFSGGVGDFDIKASLSTDQMKTNDAASLVVTISGRGNVSLLGAPEVKLHPDMEVYDPKITDNSDRSAGGTIGSKSFEYPFIPRSHGEFTIDPIEYSYYDVNEGRYVTLQTEPLTYVVERGSGGSQTSGGSTLQTVEKKGIRTLGEDIRYITTKKPSLNNGNAFMVGRPLYWLLVVFLIALATVLWTLFRKAAAMKADVVGSKTRKANKMALKRLKLAENFLNNNLYTAFYEELHRALLGYVSDKLNMTMEALNRDNISEKLLERGVSKEYTDSFISLLDACEFARYAPESGNEAMAAHYRGAVDVISSIESCMKTNKNTSKVYAAIAILFMLPFAAKAEDSYLDSLWNKGVAAYENGQWDVAASSWDALLDAGCTNAELYYNSGNAWFKLEDYPQAILRYERALKEDVSYSDARYNLEFAQAQIQDRIDSVPEFIFKTWFRKISNLMPSDTWAVLSLLFLALTLAMLLMFLLSSSTGKRRLGFYLGIVSIVLTLFSFSFAKWQYSDYISKDSAIVMSPVSSVKSSPTSGSAKDLFVLHGGAKVQILDNVGDWTNISLADGRQGWIKTEDIEII